MVKRRPPASLSLHAKWAATVTCWIGANALLVFGPDAWSFLFHPKVSWSVRYAYQSRELPIDSPNGSRVLKYRLLEPVQSHAPCPLVLFLHGAGERGDDNTSQLSTLPSLLATSKWRENFTAFVLAPQCPPNSNWHREMPGLVSLLESWRNDARVDPRRIYVTGFSMGGYGTWHVAAAKPEWIAAAVPICGGGDPEHAHRLVAVPIWAVHGSDDSVVPTRQSTMMVDAIRKASGQPRYTELAGIGHNAWSTAYGNPDGVLTWMFQQVNDRCEECQ